MTPVYTKAYNYKKIPKINEELLSRLMRIEIPDRILIDKQNIKPIIDNFLEIFSRVISLGAVKGFTDLTDLKALVLKIRELTNKYEEIEDLN